MGSSVDITIKAVDEASKVMGHVANSANDMSDALADAGNSAGKTNLVGTFTEIASKIDVAKQAASLFTGTIREAFEFGEQGAQVLQTARSFETLMESVGGSSDTLDKLRAASRGTIDDMRLMSSTTTLLAGAQGELATSLADSTPALMEIAKAANKLNPALGDTTYMYESLALGIKRGSPMIIDNLGITLKLGEANAAYAASLGKTVEELTANEQKQALLNEVLRAGKVLIEQSGGSADSATDSFARLEAATKNLGDAFMAQLAPPLASAAEGLTTLMTMGQQTAAAWHEHEAVMQGTAKSYEEYRNEMIRAAEVAGMLNIDMATAEMEGMGAAVDKAADSIGILTEEEWNNVRAATDNTDITERLKDAYDKLDTSKAVEGISNIDGALATANEAIDAQLEKLGQLQSQQANWAEGLGNDVGRALEQAELSTDDYRLALLATDQVTGTTLHTQYKQEEQVKKLIAAYKETGNLAAFRDGLRDINEEFNPFEDQVNDAIEKVGDLKDALAGLNGTLTMNVRWEGSGPGGGGGKGGSGGGGGSRDDDRAELRALGGPVAPGEVTQWNEYGREMLVTNQGGYVMTAGQTRELLDAIRTMNEGGRGSGGSPVLQVNQLILPGVTNARDLGIELQTAFLSDAGITGA